MVLRLRRQRSDGALRSQHAALRLEQDEGEVVAAKAWVQGFGARHVQTLHRDAAGRKRPLGLRLPSVLTVSKPREAALEEKLLARLLLELAPERARAPSHHRVVAVGAVRAAVEPRFAA